MEQNTAKLIYKNEPTDRKAAEKRDSSAEKKNISIFGSIPFVSVHLGCLTVLWSGISWSAVVACISLVFVRMFGITGGYHRYFSHRSFKTTRFFQFCLAWLGATAAQMGPLWWAAHHRHHHRYSDTPKDIHPPEKGFWWAHFGWILCRDYAETKWENIRDFARFPELRFIDKFYVLPPLLLAVALAVVGALLKRYAPSLGTSGFQMLAWGFFVSTVLLYHFTFSINSITHKVGTRRFETTDSSRNVAWLAIFTMGEGWHNNHHRYPFSERQGFYWWEIDLTHYILKMLSWVRLVWDIKGPPPEVYARA